MYANFFFTLQKKIFSKEWKEMPDMNAEYHPDQTEM